MQKSLLSHIAGKFISEYENVANSSIAYLLNEYPASRVALKQLIEVEKVPSYYVTELSTDSNGRPDITGLDYEGQKVVIIEGKFWANLTENQPVNYLKELSKGGKLLFLAPEKRLSSLKFELEKRLGGVDSRIVVFSWNGFINLIEQENNKNHNSLLASDLLQLKELCKKMDSEGMPPLSQSDIDPMNGRVATQFADIIDECNSLLREWKHSDFWGLKTTSFKYGHGFYFYAYESACFLSFNSHHWFVKENHAPFWLHIKTDEWVESEKIAHALNSFDSANSDGCEYGITLQSGMDKDQITSHIISKVKEVTKFLNEKINNE